ncbi:MAG: SRPBCC family protein [Burkholderiaceae bacterium]|nr:SRPBCC family protein [Burkholderiaceae bacterium]
MPRYAASLDIRATHETVWMHLSDVLDWPKWLPTVSAVDAVRGAALNPGSRFLIRQPRLKPQVWTVTDIQPGKSFTWEAGSPGTLLVASHTVIPTGPMSCRVSLVFRFHGIVGVVFGVILGSLTRKYLATEAASLRQVSEAGDPGGHLRLEVVAAP